MASKRVAHIFSAITTALGSVPAVIGSVLLVVVWFAGAFFIKGHFANDSYQLLINTATTIITFLMVFVIQNTTNRESKAMNAKLDALIKKLAPELHDPDLHALIGIEDETEQTIDDERERIKND